MPPAAIIQELSRQRFYKHDFSGQDLSKAKMKHSLFSECNFDNADMSEADCQGSEFFGSTFRDTKLYRTNFADAKLANTVFMPRDAFGITLTMNCKTFENMQVSQLWLLSFLMLGSMMLPETEPVKTDFRDGILAVIGAERYTKLRAMFARREM